jgi:hypothetical protein
MKHKNQCGKSMGKIACTSYEAQKYSMKAPRVWEKITLYKAQKNEGSESVGKNHIHFV